MRRAAQEINRADRGLVRRTAAIPPSAADEGLKRLTRTANHSLLWFAARVSPFRPPSGGEGGMAALRRTSPLSTRLISCATRRNQSSTSAA